MTKQSAYAQAGVDIAAGHQATQLMKTAVQATFGSEVLSDVGNFGGLYSAKALKEMKSPVLVASTDGVGTKTMVAAAMNRWDTIGQDIVFLNPLRSVGAHLNHVNALKRKISQPIFDGKKAEFFFALANVLIIIHGK